MGTPLQSIATSFAPAGDGSTLTLIIAETPAEHPAKVGVNVKVTIRVLLLLLVRVPLILPGKAIPVWFAYAVPPVDKPSVLLTVRDQVRSDGFEGAVTLVRSISTVPLLHIVDTVFSVAVIDGDGSTTTLTTRGVPAEHPAS